MELRELSVPLKGAAGDYARQAGFITSCFDYMPSDEGYQKRLDDIKDRVYPRAALAAHLLRYNEELGAGQRTRENIAALQEEQTYAVVGGQQAGLLTGPLYTIHKIISIVQLAKEQEQKRGVRVVPIFWIAGEDHDLDEINHLFVLRDEQVRKTVLPQKVWKKASASDTALDHAAALQWVEGIFRTYRETAYTNDLLQLVKRCLQQSQTYVDFFARLITVLFEAEGLILMDSGHPEVRNIEQGFLQTLLQKHEEIGAALARQQQKLTEAGYERMIVTKPESVNLFLHDGGERRLLEKQTDGFTYPGSSRVFTAEELSQQIAQAPQLFSNNVVTRPLMQEYLLPTLAFIGGPGEAAYWAELQEVFHAVGYQMPPVVLRHMISYVERGVAADLRELGVAEEAVLNGQAPQLREQWLARQVQEPIADIFAQARADIEEAHRPLRELTARVNSGLTQFAEKNRAKIEEQLQLLERTLQRSVEERHAAGLAKFRRAENALRPLGAPQERVWNVLYYLNEYGFEFIPNVLSLPFGWDDTHKCVVL